MPDPSQLTEPELARQAQAYFDSLRASGVEWLPFASLSGPPPVLDAKKGSDPSIAQALNPPPAVEGMTAAAAPAGHTVEPTLPADLFVAQEPATQVAPTPPLSIEDRRKALQVLAEKISTCPRCPELAATRTQTVFGVGQPGVELCFVGEAPGGDEDAQGEPFVGAAGQLLNRIIVACRLKREEVYICNIIKCRPPGNRTPLVHEVANCREYFEQQIALVRPKFICARLRGCPEPARHYPVAGQAAGTVPRLPGHSRAGHVPPGLPVAAPQPGEEKRRLERHEAAAGPHGSAGGLSPPPPAACSTGRWHCLTDARNDFRESQVASGVRQAVALPRAMIN